MSLNYKQISQAVNRISNGSPLSQDYVDLRSAKEELQDLKEEPNYKAIFFFILILLEISLMEIYSNKIMGYAFITVTFPIFILQFSRNIIINTFLKSIDNAFKDKEKGHD